MTSNQVVNVFGYAVIWASRMALNTEIRRQLGVPPSALKLMEEHDLSERVTRAVGNVLQRNGASVTNPAGSYGSGSGTAASGSDDFLVDVDMFELGSGSAVRVARGHAKRRPELTAEELRALELSGHLPIGNESPRNSFDASGLPQPAATAGTGLVGTLLG